MKVGFVVQRYGTEVVGGAELHCRWVAEHLAERHEVEVLTTTATDYLSWKNALEAGESQLNGVTVRRFPVARDRDVDRFDPPRPPDDQRATRDSTIPQPSDAIAYATP